MACGLLVPSMSQLIFLVFFVYGLAFFGMGLAMALESGRSPALAHARVLGPLSAFGLIHGTHEWMESYLLQADSLGTPLPAWIPWLRLGLLVTSFASLFLFAINLLRLISPRSILKRIVRIGAYLLYASTILASAFLAYRYIPIPWLDILDGLARYLLAVPAAMLATIALRAWSRSARRENREALTANLSLTALGFGVYALTQFFVHPLEMFPARFLNEVSFLAISGFPIQVIRTLMAVLITISLLRAVYVMDEERKAQLFTAQQSRLDALLQQENLRRDLWRHTIRAQEDERARIARELHDQTAQELSAFSLELATLRSMLGRQKRAIGKVEHLQALSRQISQGLYRLVRDLRPAQLDDLGLVAALRYLLGQYHLSMNMDVDFKVEGEPRRLEPLVETVLFRVTQEALNNIVRHAGTPQAQMNLNYEQEKVYLTVADQGQGFDANGRFAEPRGWGLAGMRERVESVGGEFHLTSAPGEGTRIEVIIPVMKK
jgi:signal transduction histidine kinase